MISETTYVYNRNGERIQEFSVPAVWKEITTVYPPSPQQEIENIEIIYSNNENSPITSMRITFIEPYYSGSMSIKIGGKKVS